MQLSPDTPSLVVLGGGPAGYPAAFLAADLGFDVTLVDSAPSLGGTCLHRGCIPSKALLHAARLASLPALAAPLGIAYPLPAVDLPRLRAWTASVVSRLSSGLDRLASARRIRRIQATAAFASPDSLLLRAPDGTSTALPFANLLLAPGSHPILPPGWPAPSDRVWTSDQALALPCIPDSLLVVGGGVIGLELASVYAAFGTRVHLVELAPALVPGADPDLVVPLYRALRASFASIRLRSRILELTETPDGVSAVVESPDAPPSRETFSHVLVAVGRRPATDALNLAAAGLSADPRGFVAPPPSSPILVAGDASPGGPMLAHRATHQATSLVLALAHHPSAPAPDAPPPPIPSAVYTTPSLAWTGLTETAAKAASIPYVARKFPLAASGRALAEQAAEGFVKLLFDPDTQRLLGAAAVAPQADAIVAELTLALSSRLTAADIAAAVHPHPSYAEAVAQASLAALGLSPDLLPARPRPAR